MVQYPMPFKVSAHAEAGIQVAWQTRAHSTDQTVNMAIPPEFSGPGGGLSPEDIYAMALQNCFIATFKVFAEKSRLVYRDIDIESTLEVDRDAAGKPWMARIHLNVALNGVESPDNAKRILERTSQSCMILNSVNTEKSFNFEIKGN